MGRLRGVRRRRRRVGLRRRGLGLPRRLGELHRELGHRLGERRSGLLEQGEQGHVAALLPELGPVAQRVAQELLADPAPGQDLPRQPLLGVHSDYLAPEALTAKMIPPTTATMNSTNSTILITLYGRSPATSPVRALTMNR